MVLCIVPGPETSINVIRFAGDNKITSLDQFSLENYSSDGIGHRDDFAVHKRLSTNGRDDAYSLCSKIFIILEIDRNLGAIGKL